MSTTAQAPGAPLADPPEELEREEQAPLWKRLLSGSSTQIGLVLVVLLVVFSVLAPGKFTSTDNLRNVAVDAAVLLILSVGMTYVIITAGIDLSIGGVLVFSGVVAARSMNAVGDDGWGVIALGLVVCIGAGLAWGVLNGFLIARLKIPALIVTLGTLGMSMGAALLITGGIDERSVPPTLTREVGIGRLFDQIPWLVVVALVIALVAGVWLARTRFGRYTYAVGSNEEAARRSGISVDLHLIKVYGLMGGLAGLAGFLSLARFGTTTIGGHSTDNLNAIAAVVIGGTSLFGGIGTIVGTVIGVFIPAVLQNGFVIVGVQPFWQQVAVGAVLIVAVYLDQLRRRSRDRH